MLKLFVYGYINRVQSSHHLECEAQRNVELIWLTGRFGDGLSRICDEQGECQQVQDESSTTTSGTEGSSEQDNVDSSNESVLPSRIVSRHLHIRVQWNLSLRSSPP